MKSSRTILYKTLQHVVLWLIETKWTVTGDIVYLCQGISLSRKTFLVTTMLPHLIPLQKDWRINKTTSIGQLEYIRTLQCKMWYNYYHNNHHTNYYHIEFSTSFMFYYHKNYYHSQIDHNCSINLLMIRDQKKQLVM